MSIILQSTAGGFSAEFMRKLPLIERAMREDGLDPSQFVISKDRASTSLIPGTGPYVHDYSVYFGDDHFIVTEPNDMLFLDYFYKRVLASDEMPTLRQPPGLLKRFLGWMAAPV